MNNKSLEEIKFDAQEQADCYDYDSDIYMEGANFIINNHYAPLLSRNEELEKCVRELVEVTKTIQQYLNVFILRGEEPLLGENSKTDSYNTITALSNAKKILNNE